MNGIATRLLREKAALFWYQDLFPNGTESRKHRRDDREF